MMKTSDKTPPHLTLIRCLAAAAIAAPVIWLAYMVLSRPALLAKSGIYILLPGPVTAIPFVAIIACAVSALGVLVVQNRHRLRGVLRPNFGRILCALLMAGLTPLVLVGGLPVAAGLVTINFSVPQNLLLGLSPLLPWYLASSLIISGVQSRWWRIGLFWLIWCACYSAIVLIKGIERFMA